LRLITSEGYSRSILTGFPATLQLLRCPRLIANRVRRNLLMMGVSAHHCQVASGSGPLSDCPKTVGPGRGGEC
jgi:hypothetical protein